MERREEYKKHSPCKECLTCANCNPKRTGEWKLERNNSQKDNDWELSKPEERFIQEFLSTPSNIVRKVYLYPSW